MRQSAQSAWRTGVRADPTSSTSRAQTKVASRSLRVDLLPAQFLSRPPMLNSGHPNQLNADTDMALSVRSWLLTCVSAFMVFACASIFTACSKTCPQDSVRACSCADGSESTQRCNSEGTHHGPCSCSNVAKTPRRPMTFATCMQKKKPMMSACMPGCDADPNLIGEAYDNCLNSCAKARFGKPIPMCSQYR
jgi:hypothetical protein